MTSNIRTTAVFLRPFKLESFEEVLPAGAGLVDGHQRVDEGAEHGQHGEHGDRQKNVEEEVHDHAVLSQALRLADLLLVKGK